MAQIVRSLREEIDQSVRALWDVEARVRYANIDAGINRQHALKNLAEARRLMFEILIQMDLLAQQTSGGPAEPQEDEE